MREYNLKLDDVINEQRNIVYHLRNKILEESDRVSIVIPRIEATAQNLITKYCSEEEVPEKWPLQQLKAELENIVIDKEISFPRDHFELRDIQEIVQTNINEHIDVLKSYLDDEELQYGLKQVMTYIIDHNWIKHLENMTRLKEGIGMRHYQQEDPMRLYQIEGLELFEQMYALLSKEMSVQLTALLKHLK
jgi:preprotein translocase subunit SecA